MKKTSILFAIAVVGSFILSTTGVQAANCTPRATKQCVSNIAYWYDSCGALQEVAQNCNTTNSTCQNGQCVDVNPGIVTPTPTPAPAPTTITTIQNNTTQTPTQTTAISVNQGLVISLFANKSTSDLSLSKNINVTNNDALTFLIIVKNNSGAQVDNVSITANTTDNISYTGNLKIDDAPSAGNVTAGINLGTIPAKVSKAISFTGTVQSQVTQGNFQIATNVNSGNILYDSDSVTATIGNANVENPATQSTTNGSFFSNISKNWYLWIVIIIVLVVIFIIIFRRLSSNV